MKAGVHPESQKVSVNCTGCSNKFTIMSAMKNNTFTVASCSNCHSAYTKKRRIVAAGAVDKFNKKYQAYSKSLNTENSNDN